MALSRRAGTSHSSLRTKSWDFKFGLAAGYVGSFKYQLKMDNYEEQGESGYCEYVDCRALKWQKKIKKKIEKLEKLFLFTQK